MRIKSGMLLGAVVLLSACGAAQLPWAPDERVAKASYRLSGAATVTLLTVIANDSGSAGHSALLINGSQRVLYDPAGTWYNHDVPERADLLYGMTPQMMQNYLDYHARKRFHVVKQTKVVSPQVAEQMIVLAKQMGASANGMCAQNTSAILSQTPGFEGFPVSVWPKSAVEAFSRIQGSKTEKVYQDDEGKTDLNA